MRGTQRNAVTALLAAGVPRVPATSASIRAATLRVSPFGARATEDLRWLEGRARWGRPVDLEVLPDGSMLLSDDTAGVIYRSRYGK